MLSGNLLSTITHSVTINEISNFIQLKKKVFQSISGGLLISKDLSRPPIKVASIPFDQ